MNKFDRITAILIHLQSKRLVTAQELAERFEVSQRTIYRDIETLNSAGVPIIGELGVGYSIMEGYRLPPVMFSREEAVSFLIAEKILEKYGDAQYKKHFQTALFKIKSVLRGAEKGLAEEMGERITVIKNVEQNIILDKNLPLIIRSLTDKEILKVDYLMLLQEDKQTSLIEPIGIINENGNWLTIAFNHENNLYKKFRIDRMVQLKLTGEKSSRTHISLDDFLAQGRSNQTVYKPVIAIKKEVAHYIEEQKHLYGLVEERDDNDYIEMTFKTTCLQTFCRWFLTIADNAKVLQPKELKSLLGETVSAIKKNL